MLASAVHLGPDLTPSVMTGLAWFYLLVCLGNIAYAAYQQRALGRKRAATLWYIVSGVFLLHAIIYFAGVEMKLPFWLKELSDHGLEEGLNTLGVLGGTNTTIVGIFTVIFYVVLIATFADVALTYLFGARKLTDGLAKPIFCGMDTTRRMTTWSLLVTVLALILYGTNAITYFLLSVVVLAALFVWRKPLTEPDTIWLVLNFALLFGGWSMTDVDFRDIIAKPDNVPIVGMVFLVGFFTWLAMRKAVINDDRIAQGLPPTEKEDDDKVLVWPDLVYTELICMIVVTVVLVVWAVALPAPLEQPASSTKTPNPSKAPWYFLGLQEMLVYYDPWIAGVVLPTIIIIGLMAMPYIDFNTKGNGYYSFDERKFSIVTFLFGFIVLWVTLIFLGTFLRGPNWNFFGLYETRDAHKLVTLNNVNLSEYFWIQGLNTVWDRPGEKTPFGTILIRESPGIVLVLFYFLVIPPLFAKTLLRNFFIRMGFIRYFILVTLMLFMASLPIKMVLRWTVNLKYIVAIPEYFFNI